MKSERHHAGSRFTFLYFEREKIQRSVRGQKKDEKPRKRKPKKGDISLTICMQRVFDISLSSPPIFVFDKRCPLIILRESLLMNVEMGSGFEISVSYFFCLCEGWGTSDDGLPVFVHRFLLGPFLMSSFAGLTSCVPCLLNWSGYSACVWAKRSCMLT